MIVDTQRPPFDHVHLAGNFTPHDGDANGARTASACFAGLYKVGRAVRMCVTLHCLCDKALLLGEFLGTFDLIKFLTAQNAA
jgi:hypothetical protein